MEVETWGKAAKKAIMPSLTWEVSWTGKGPGSGVRGYGKCVRVALVTVGAGWAALVRVGLVRVWDMGGYG